MPESDTNKGRKRRRKKRSAGEGDEQNRRAGLVISIATGTGLGALIGLITGYLLAPKPHGASATEPGQALRAWREMVRKLSEQLQAGGMK